MTQWQKNIYYKQTQMKPCNTEQNTTNGWDQKTIKVENIRIQITEEEKVWYLIRMDDVVIITGKGDEMQKMMNITYNTTQT